MPITTNIPCTFHCNTCKTVFCEMFFPWLLLSPKHLFSRWILPIKISKGWMQNTFNFSCPSDKCGVLITVGKCIFQIHVLQCSCRFIPKYTVYKFIYLMLLLFCPDLNLFRHIRVLVQEYRTKEKFAPTVLNLPTDDEGQKGLKYNGVNTSLYTCTCNKSLLEKFQIQLFSSFLILNFESFISCIHDTIRCNVTLHKVSS